MLDAVEEPLVSRPFQARATRASSSRAPRRGDFEARGIRREEERTAVVDDSPFLESQKSAALTSF